MPVRKIDHVQLAMPTGGEGAARGFYAGLLGITEQQKPEPLAKRGGSWFENGDLKIHLGVEAEFRPAHKAHPALLVDDPFGNRLELMEPNPVNELLDRHPLHALLALVPRPETFARSPWNQRGTRSVDLASPTHSTVSRRPEPEGSFGVCGSVRPRPAQPDPRL